MRLDRALVLRGLCRSRTEAQQQIKAGGVMIDGDLAGKASQEVPAEAALTLTGAQPRYVSRGGLKLQAALEEFGIEVIQAKALDVGASTGGFTDCLLQNGAASVLALDVGHGQMTAALAADPRVTLREGVNARYLLPSDFPGLFDILVADLSFISLTLVLPALAPLLAPEGNLICLVKPQFEVGMERLGKGGIVRDKTARADVLNRVSAAGRHCGLREQGRMTSPITGGDGNIEFLLWLKREAGSGSRPGE